MTTWCMQACGLNALVVYFNVKTHDIRQTNVATRRGDLNWAHPSPRVLGYKRASDINIKEGDITKVRVYPRRRSGLVGKWNHIRPIHLTTNKHKIIVAVSFRRGFCTWTIKILVFPNPTSRMLWSFGFLYQIEVYSIDSPKTMGKFELQPVNSQTQPVPMPLVIRFFPFIGSLGI